MSGSTRISPTEITGPLGAIVKRFSRKMLGDVPEPLGVYWHNPKVTRFYLGLGQKSNAWNSCDAELKSLAHMAVASLVGCTWCLDFGYFMAHTEGLTETKIREVPRRHESEVFSPLEHDVMDYAEAMSQTPPAVTDELFERLLDALGEPAMVELTAQIGLANLYTRTNIAFGIEAQGLAASCGLAPLPQPSDSIQSNP